jgi:hypothetical protein
MSEGRASLLAGRNTKPLDDSEITRAANTFYGLDREVPFRFAGGERTRCRVYSEDGTTQCEIVFGTDIYPGNSVVDPNSSLSVQAAAAHELSHYHRWLNKTELDGEHLTEIDEALTSLEAILRYSRNLSETETKQLVSDALQRLQLFAQRYKDGFGG